MPKAKTTKQEPIETQEETSVQEPTPITGYRPKPRHRWVTLDAIDVEEGGEPFKARIRSHLTFAQIEEIPFGRGVRYDEMEAAIAPYVVAWNVVAVNDETGELESVPPPAEAGPDAFKTVSGAEVEWLAGELRVAGYIGSADEEKKDLTPSGPTAEPGAAAS